MVNNIIHVMARPMREHINLDGPAHDKPGSTLGASYDYLKVLDPRGHGSHQLNKNSTKHTWKIKTDK